MAEFCAIRSSDRFPSQAWAQAAKTILSRKFELVGFKSKKTCERASTQARRPAGAQAGRQAGRQAGKQASRQASKQPTSLPAYQPTNHRQTNKTNCKLEGPNHVALASLKVPQLERFQLQCGYGSSVQDASAQGLEPKCAVTP